MSAPFFIVGASRSGTTMLRLMLNAHSRLAVPDELKYFRHVDGLYDLTAWQTPLSTDERRALVRGYLAARGDVFPGTSADLETVALADSDRTLRGPYRTLLAHWARSRGKGRWGEKTPHNIFYVDVLADMFPDAQFVHVVRDPRAVVQSMNASSYYSGETVFNALNWRKSIRHGTRLCRDHLRSDQHLTVQYEALVRRPEPTLRAVCAFLSESFEPQMLRFYETAERDMAGQIRTPSIASPVTEEAVSKWRERLVPAAVAIIERLCGKEMETYGYPPTMDRGRSDLWSPPIILFKVLYWQWKVWRHRHRRGYEVEYSFLSGLRARLRQWRAILSGRRGNIEKHMPPF